MSTNTPNEKPYVRLATIAEVEALSEIAVRAFIHDPVMNYVNNVDHVSVRQSQMHGQAVVLFGGGIANQKSSF